VLLVRKIGQVLLILRLLGRKRLKSVSVRLIVARFLLTLPKKYLLKRIELCSEARTLCCSCQARGSCRGYLRQRQETLIGRHVLDAAIVRTAFRLLMGCRYHLPLKLPGLYLIVEGDHMDAQLL